MLGYKYKYENFIVSCRNKWYILSTSCKLWEKRKIGLYNETLKESLSGVRLLQDFQPMAAQLSYESCAAIG